jgi:hypothetical protein
VSYTTSLSTSSLSTSSLPTFQPSSKLPRSPATYDTSHLRPRATYDHELPTILIKMLTFTILASLVTLTLALPSSTLSKRAGGPAISPIPSSCTISHPLPTATADETYIPAPSTSGVLIYSAYYPSPSTNKTALALQCLQQCYGYGYKGDCVASYWAENVPTPSGYYGTAGGYLETACLYYSRELTETDFVVAPKGQATTPSAGNISC